jgi:regulator of RNase E activity RraA/CMP-N-acetylneuraminic acid synthetase
MKIVAFVPAKGTSSRVESKNTKVLCGKPLFLYSLDKLIMSNVINEVFLDSESDYVFSLAGDRRYSKIKRDSSLANNSTDGNKLFLNEVSHVDADIYIQLLATAPFISLNTIENAVDILKKNDEFDSVILVNSQKLYKWENNRPAYDINHIPNSIDLPATLNETMGLYVCRASVPNDLGRRIGNKPFLMIADPIETIDINTYEDFQIAEYLMNGILLKEVLKFEYYSRFLSTAIISDILDEYGINKFISGLKPNIPGVRVVARAKTLKLRKIVDGENPDLIYKALNSYEHVNMGEIIVVENEVDDFAYFGSLNAQISIRLGVKAAIINGVTRDNDDVYRLGFPVFSKGYSAKDVKGRAVLDYFNKEIVVDGVSIFPGDLIVVDSEGIIVIPKEIEFEVISRAIQTFNQETNIKTDLLNDFSIQEILKRNGNF